MDLTKLQALVAQLRALGVTKYECGDVKLELGPEPAKPQAPNLAVDGFKPSTGRSPELDSLLSKLDPAYARAFDIR